MQDSKKILNAFTTTLLILSGVVFSISCKNDIESINQLTQDSEGPTATYTNVALEYSDTAKLQAKLIAEKILFFNRDKNKPYYEFPVGMEILFYNDNQGIKSRITSKYAIWLVDEELLEARDSVVARNIEEGQVIETEQMFWDQEKRLIYSEVFTKITTEDVVTFAQKGFEATQDFESFRLNGTKGRINIKDEE